MHAVSSGVIKYSTLWKYSTLQGKQTMWPWFTPWHLLKLHLYNINAKDVLRSSHWVYLMRMYWYFWPFGIVYLLTEFDHPSNWCCGCAAVWQLCRTTAVDIFCSTSLYSTMSLISIPRRLFLSLSLFTLSLSVSFSLSNKGIHSSLLLGWCLRKDTWKKREREEELQT